MVMRKKYHKNREPHTYNIVIYTNAVGIAAKQHTSDMMLQKFQDGILKLFQVRNGIMMVLTRPECKNILARGCSDLVQYSVQPMTKKQFYGYIEKFPFSSGSKIEEKKDELCTWKPFCRF